MTGIDTFFSFLCGRCVCVWGGGGGGVRKTRVGHGGGRFKKVESKVWGVHIIPVGNILNSSELPPRP